MNLKKTALSFLAAPLLAAPLMALAAGGYTGPGAVVQPSTVAAALEAADDTPVVLQGRITQRLKGDLYEFQDSTGSIKVEIDDEDWPPQTVDHNVKVKITGEVERSLVGREIDVDLLEVLP